MNEGEMPSMRESDGGMQMTLIESFLLPEKVHITESNDSGGEDPHSRTAEVVVRGSGNSKLRIADALTVHVGVSGDWGSILCDPIIATAVLDWLLPLQDHEGQAATGLTSVPVSAPTGTEAREA
jgi:hypothetical protein